MKIGVLIPTRGDRPEFLQNCFRMLKAQTVQPYIIHVVDEAPQNDDCDITYRYKKGYEFLSNNLELDVIAFIEDDDYYAPDYLEYMSAQWVANGKPDLLGCDYTIYYNVLIRKYFFFNHADRSSAMNTWIKPGLNFPWCPDSEPYTDLHLWRVLKGTIIHPSHHICIGIKHGVGKTGGFMHVDRFQRYTNEDNGFLQQNTDSESFNFYNSFK